MQRPRIRPKKTIVDTVLEISSFLLVGASVIIIAINYSDLPEKIQIPFNWPSKSDQGMASKATLWMSPLICGIIVTVLFILNRFPWIFNYPVKITEENARALYRIANQLLRSISITVGLLCITTTLLPILSVKGIDTTILLIVVPFLIVAILFLLVVSIIRMMKNR